MRQSPTANLFHPIIKLKFNQTPNHPLLCEVHNIETGEIIIYDTLVNVARWLQIAGYKWFIGSQAVYFKQG